MHYANGREAKNGDKVVYIPRWGTICPETGKVFTNAMVGILYDAVPGNDNCNGKIALTSPNDPMPDLKDVLHIEDCRLQESRDSKIAAEVE